jgi:hypothetical protein
MATDTIDRGQPRRVVCDPAVADIGWPWIDRLGGSIDLLGVTRGELKEGLARVGQKRWPNIKKQSKLRESRSQRKTTQASVSD